MSDHHMNHSDRGSQSFLTSRAGLVMLGFLAIGFVLLFTEHRAHVLGALPFLFLLACPLMHVFMHGGHHHEHDSSSGSKEQSQIGAENQ